MTTGMLERTDTGEMAVVRVAPRNYVADMHAINDHYGALIDRAVHSITRRVHRAYDEAIAEALDGARLPQPWPTAEDFADHLGVDLLIEARWDTGRMRAQRRGTVALANAKLRALWPADVQPGSVTFAELPPEPDPVRAYFDADSSDDLPGREVPGDGIPALAAAYHGERGGWTPEKPLSALTPAPEGTYTQHGAAETGPRWRRIVDAVVDVVGKWVRL